MNIQWPTVVIMADNLSKIMIATLQSTVTMMLMKFIMIMITQQSWVTIMVNNINGNDS